MRLVLWDVDHTLLELRRLHYEMYARGLDAAFGRHADELPDMSGRTDRDSSSEFLSSQGIEPTEENLQRFWSALTDELHRVEPELPRLGHPTEGAKAALATLAEVPDLHQSVLTGNLRVLAEAKLAAFGLDEYLDFDIGGYGEDSLVRADLVAAARSRLTAKHGITADLERTVLVGDTPLDIEAAHASGARVVAVATGKSPYEVLTEAGADVVIHDLTDAQTVLAAVEAASGGRRSPTVVAPAR